MASADREHITGVLAGAEPPAGSRGRAPGQGVRRAKPPEAESILALGRPTDTANLHPWPVAVFFQFKASCSNLNPEKYN